MPNALGRATSPYLLQHANNPVEWFEWGPEARRRAADLDRPLFISIGYASCHWCHVMAHESFEDEATARFLNEHYVSVKVDREERPDVDAVYMGAVQAMTGSGGWPLSVIATPQGVPFFGGTYFPPVDRPGMPSFGRVLRALAQAWRERRDEVEASAASLRAGLVSLGAPPAGAGTVSAASAAAEPAPARGDPAVAAPETEVERQAAAALDALAATFDAADGGFGGAPKFPPHGALRFLLRRPEERARSMATAVLDAMADGGIWDHLGGGFHRYSVDGSWRVPHFEKMLYDNAQLLQRYAEAFALTRRERYREVGRGIVAWLAREMRVSDGGFASALDADSEGDEGRFYVWDAAEVDAIAAGDAGLARSAFGIREVGELDGRNVLRRAAGPEELAPGRDPDETAARLAGVRQRLLGARERRVRPAQDDKVLASWNGLALAALADAARLLGDGEALAMARANAEFLRRNLWRGGRLFHAWRAGSARIEGLLEDYAYVGLGLLALYRVTLEGGALAWAIDLGDAVVERFEDVDGGGFFSTSADLHDADALPVRPRSFVDAAVPSDNAAAAELLARLARVTGRERYLEAAERALALLGDAPARYPQAFASTLVTRDLLAAAPVELVLLGAPGESDTRALREVWLERAREDVAVLALADADDPLAARSALAAGRQRLAGRATAYLCRGGACRLPVTEASDLARQLDEAGLTPLPR